MAAAISTPSFAPQAWHIIKTRDTISISVYSAIVTVVGFSFWLSYGLLTSRWPLVISNALCLLLSAFILVMKLLSQDKKEAVREIVDPNP
jgi:MtN3 and saliva related transmembrane protein